VCVVVSVEGGPPRERSCRQRQLPQRPEAQHGKAARGRRAGSNEAGLGSELCRQQKHTRAPCSPPSPPRYPLPRQAIATSSACPAAWTRPSSRCWRPPTCMACGWWRGRAMHTMRLGRRRRETWWVPACLPCCFVVALNFVCTASLFSPKQAVIHPASRPPPPHTPHHTTPPSCLQFNTVWVLDSNKLGFNPAEVYHQYHNGIGEGSRLGVAAEAGRLPPMRRTRHASRHALSWEPWRAAERPAPPVTFLESPLTPATPQAPPSPSRTPRT
jgi:hypothetical protein